MKTNFNWELKFIYKKEAKNNLIGILFIVDNELIEILESASGGASQPGPLSAAHCTFRTLQKRTATDRGKVHYLKKNAIEI